MGLVAGTVAPKIGVWSLVGVIDTVTVAVPVLRGEPPSVTSILITL